MAIAGEPVMLPDKRRIQVYIVADETHFYWSYTMNKRLKIYSDGMAILDAITPNNTSLADLEICFKD